MTCHRFEHRLRRELSGYRGVPEPIVAVRPAPEVRNATNGGFGRTNDGCADERPAAFDSLR
jgi:hypothetical protein